MVTDVDVALLLTHLAQGAGCAVVREQLTTTTAWNTRTERISIPSKSLLLWKFHLIVFLFQGKATSLCCYYVQLKTLELQDKSFHGQNPSNMLSDPRNSNQSLLFVSWQNEYFSQLLLSP